MTFSAVFAIALGLIAGGWAGASSWKHALAQHSTWIRVHANPRVRPSADLTVALYDRHENDQRSRRRWILPLVLVSLLMGVYAYVFAMLGWQIAAALMGYCAAVWAVTATRFYAFTLGRNPLPNPHLNHTVTH